jgi:hypothetical protein
MEKAHFPVKTFHHQLEFRHAPSLCCYQKCMRGDEEGMIWTTVSQRGEKAMKIFSSQVFKEGKSFFFSEKFLFCGKLLKFREIFDKNLSVM